MNEYVFSTKEDYLRALDTLLQRATQRIRIKDEDLRGQGWDTQIRPGMLEAFLRGDRGRRVEILLHHSNYLTAHCPLLMKLLRHYGHQLEIRAYEDLALSEEAYVLGDDRIVLHRHHWEAWHGRFALNDPPGVGGLTEQFAANWERVSGSLAYTPLGL